VVVSSNEPPTLLPPFAFYDTHIALADQLFWRLAEVGPEPTSYGHESFVPKLARAWSFSADSLTITFEIDPRARWHDGMPVTGRDVAFTFDVYRDTLINALARPRLDRIAAVTVQDSLTVEFRFLKRYPEQFYDAIYHMRILPQHFLDTIPRSELRDHDLAKRPVGNGPLRFERWDTGEAIELVGDSTFFAGRPGIRRLIWRFGGDVPTMVTQLAAAEVDLLYPVSGIENLDRIKQEEHLRTIAVPSNAFAYVGFNFRNPDDLNEPHPLLADRDLRRAITMAVDGEAIVNSVMGDGGEVPLGPLTSGLWVWNESIQTIPFDRDGARSRLAGLGWSDVDGDGVLERGDQSLSFGLLVPAPSVLRRRSAVFLQEQLKSVGIELEMQILEGNAMGARMNNRAFDSYFGAWLQDASPGSIAESWTTAGVDAGNFGAYSNPEVDRLVERARNEFDQGAAEEMWQQIIETMNADAPAIWVYGGVVTVGVHDRFDNVTLPWDEWWRNLWSFEVTPSRYIDRDLIPPN